MSTKVRERLISKKNWKAEKKKCLGVAKNDFSQKKPFICLIRDAYCMGLWRLYSKYTFSRLSWQKEKKHIKLKFYVLIKLTQSALGFLIEDQRVLYRICHKILAFNHPGKSVHTHTWDAHDRGCSSHLAVNHCDYTLTSPPTRHTLLRIFHKRKNIWGRPH